MVTWQAADGLRSNLAASDLSVVTLFYASHETLSLLSAHTAIGYFVATYGGALGGMAGPHGVGYAADCLC